MTQPETGAFHYWQGQNIRLRGLEAEDSEFFFRLNQDSHATRSLGFLPPPLPRASNKTWIDETIRKKWDGGDFFFVIEDLNGETAGSIDTHHCDARSGTFSYGLYIAPDFRRKGFAREAILMVLRFYFQELRYQKVTVDVHSDNLASIQLHEKLGFQREGCFRRAIFSEGRYLDDLWFGMTGEEFMERYS